MTAHKPTPLISTPHPARARRFRGLFGLAIAGIMSLGLVASPRPASADPCSEQQEEANSGKKNYKTVTGPDGKKTFVIQNAFVVCGKVPKPNVFYVIQATAINYEWENLKQDFLPKIRNSVKKAPF